MEIIAAVAGATAESVETTIARRLRGNSWWSLALAAIGWIGTLALAGFAFVTFLVSANNPEPRLVRTAAYLYLATAFVAAIPSLLATRYASAARRAWRGDWQRPLEAALHQEVRLLRVAVITLLVIAGWIPATFTIGFFIGLAAGPIGP